MIELGTAALEIRRLGFPVIPVDRGTKQPLIDWKPYQSRLPGEARIQYWWKKWPEANIGITTGQLSKLVVIDCDSPEAVKYLLETYPEVQHTLQARTARGVHFYLNWQDGIRNAIVVVGWHQE